MTWDAPSVGFTPESIEPAVRKFACEPDRALLHENSRMTYEDWAIADSWTFRRQSTRIVSADSLKAPHIAVNDGTDISGVHSCVDVSEPGWVRPASAGLRVSEADRDECIGFHVRVGEDAGPVLGEVERGSDRELGAVAAGREPRDDLTIVDGERNRRGWATKTMGGTGAPGGSVRKPPTRADGSHGSQAASGHTKPSPPGSARAGPWRRSARARVRTSGRRPGRSRCKP